MTFSVEILFEFNGFNQYALKVNDDSISSPNEHNEKSEIYAYE